MIRLPHSLLLLLFWTAASRAQHGMYNATLQFSASLPNDGGICDSIPTPCQGLWWARTNGTHDTWVTGGPVSSAWTSFNGSNVTVYGATHPQGAQVLITLDSYISTLVNTRSPSVVWGPLFTSPSLDPSTTHTLALEYVNATNNELDIDGRLPSIRIESIQVNGPASGGAFTTISGAAQSTTVPVPEYRDLPIAAIVQGIVGALVILPAAAIMLYSVLRDRYHPRRYISDVDGEYLDDVGPDDAARPLFEDSSSSRRSSAGSVVGALPSMAALRTDAAVSFRSPSRASSSHQSRLQPERRPVETMPLVNIS